MKKKDIEYKAFQVRMPKDLWQFLKKMSVENEVSMNKILFYCVDKYKKDLKSMLTDK